MTTKTEHDDRDPLADWLASEPADPFERGLIAAAKIISDSHNLQMTTHGKLRLVMACATAKTQLEGASK